MSIQVDDWQRLNNLRETVMKLSSENPTKVQIYDELVRQRHVWSSLSLAGIKLPYDAVTAIIEQREIRSSTGLTTEQQQVLDLDAAYGHMCKLATEQQSLKLADLRGINWLVMLKTAPEKGVAGALRTDNQQVVQRLTGLINWYNGVGNRQSPIKVAGMFYQQILQNEPFAMGNGRTARLVLNLILRRAGYPTINFRPLMKLDLWNQAGFEQQLTDLVIKQLQAWQQYLTTGEIDEF